MQLSKLASTFQLDLVASPRVATGWGRTGGALSPTIVGIPFCPTLDSEGLLLSPISDFVDLTPDEAPYPHLSAATLNGSLRRTARERMRFVRFARVLHLEEELDSEDDDCFDGEDEGVGEQGREPTRQGHDPLVEGREDELGAEVDVASCILVHYVLKESLVRLLDICR